MADKQDRLDTNRRIWNRIVDPLAQQRNRQAGCDLHQRSLIDLNRLIQKMEQAYRPN